MTFTSVKMIQNATVIASENAYFARHETFHPRSGWLKKGFDAVTKNQEIFSLPDAHILLGVGKNMATAIKYWCAAYKLISSAKKLSTDSTNGFYPTEFGNLLLDDDGWDPWLENPASLWLLHWNLLKTPSQATAWHFIFNEFRKTEFTTDDLQVELRNFRDKAGLNVADSSLHKDLLCILRMYAGQEAENQAKKNVGEESLECPFVELGIIQRTDDSKYYQFRQGSKPNLPAEVIVAVCLDYINTLAPGQKTISVANLLYSIASPGLVFKLTESALCSAIDAVSQKNDEISLTDSAGLVQFSFDGEPIKIFKKILDDYYG